MFRRSAVARVVPRALPLAALIAGLGATILLSPRPLLVWNVSASAPRGLYVVRPDAPVGLGDMVLAWAPDTARALAARRHYLPGNVPLIKRVAAGAGDRICGHGATITVNGVAVATRLRRDRQHRPLPAWLGCRTLGEGEYLLLMPNAESFDGRYFGPTTRRAILGKVTPLWTR